MEFKNTNIELCIENDIYVVKNVPAYVCERCGLVAYHDVKQRRYVCRVCGDKAKVSSVSVAYAFKLLLQEMQSLNVAPRLLIKEKV